MGRIIVSENVSVDGVVQDLSGEDGAGRGSWLACADEQDRQEWARGGAAEALAATALLMGRRTHEWFVARGWASRAGAWADRLRDLPKYVVTTSALTGPEWVNSTVLNGDAVREIASLTRRVEGDIVVYGSGRLVRTLIEHDLVDELRLVTYPVVAGAGDRLFGETSGLKPLRLVHTGTVGAGLAAHTYRPGRDTP
ncbi:MAG TPA: dihydrofolate reductase family protein [Actinocatenispora sp.]